MAKKEYEHLGSVDYFREVPKKSNFGTWVVLGLIGLGILAAIGGDDAKPHTSPAVYQQEQ